MAKPVRVLMCYLGALCICTLIFMWLKIQVIYIPYENDRIEIKTLMLVTIIGGIISLKLTISPGALKVFLIVYGCLWIIRFLIIFAALHIKEVNVFGREFHMDLIAPGYYSTVSRLGTPLPFVIFWLINILYSPDKKSENAAGDATVKEA